MHGLSQTFSAPSAWKTTDSNQFWRVKWRSNSLMSHRKLALFHIVRETTQPVKENHDDSESSDSDSETNSDSSSESDSDSGSVNNSRYDSGYEEGSSTKVRSTFPNDCVVLVGESTKPLWIPITLNKRISNGVPYAVHPFLPIVVLKDLNGHAIIANLETGIWRTENDSDHLKDKGHQGGCRP